MSLVIFAYELSEMASASLHGMGGGFSSGSFVDDRFSCSATGLLLEACFVV